jgi:hypothetical protein
MVRWARQAVCAATIAGIVAMSLSVALVFHLRQGHLASLSCRAVMPSGERNLCGAYAFFVAANRMGVPWSFFDITKVLGPA